MLESFAELLRTDALPPAPLPFHVALLELLERCTALGADASWRARFAEDMAGYLSGCADETCYRATQTVPSLPRYRELRARSVGTRPCFALLELEHGTPLSAAALACPELAALRERAALLAAWVNDLYSCPKELAARDPLNLVVVLARHRRVPLGEAAALAARRYDDELAALAREVASVRASTSDDGLAAYLAGLLRWVDANCVWTRRCGRYAWIRDYGQPAAQPRSPRSFVHPS